MTTIFKHGPAKVDSLYNGAAYIIAMGSQDTLLQGDDATAWREEFDQADALPDPQRALDAKLDLIARYF